MNRSFFRKALTASLAGVMFTLFATGSGAVFAQSKFSQEFQK